MTLALPPYAAHLGIALAPDAEAANGGAAAGPVLRMAFADALAGRPGNLHGGAIAGLIDMAAHAALLRALDEAGRPPRFKPIGITIDYLRGGKHRETFAQGRVTRIGSRVATVIVEAWQERGTPIAAARLHMLLAREEQ